MTQRDAQLTPFDYPLNGKLVTKLDGAILPESNFQVLENLRYNDGGIEGVSGMTKACTTVMPKLQIRNGFHFKKSSPSEEEHVFVQATNPLDNTSAIYKSNTSGVVGTITFTFAASTSVTASASCLAQGVAVGQSIYNSTNDASTYAKRITAISTNGLTITLESAYAGTTGAAKQGTVLYNSPYPMSFSLFQALDSDNIAYFSYAPDQSMVFCDGYKNYIWSGDEYRVASVLNFDPNGTFMKDNSSRAVENLNNADSSFVLDRVAGGVDSNTVALYHCESATGTTADAMGTHNLTVSGAVVSSTRKFGTNSISFDGVNDYLYKADHADFDFSDGTFTIDAWIRPTYTVGKIYPIYCQATDGDNYMLFYLLADGTVGLNVNESASLQTLVSAAGAVSSFSSWTHVAVVGDGTNYYLFVNGAPVVTAAITSDVLDYSGNITIGQFVSEYYYGRIDEIRISKNARWTDAFAPPAAAYSTTVTNITHLYIGSTRPLSGVKFYVTTPNTTTSSATGYYWDGSEWEDVGLTDATSVGGDTLARTGWMTFTSTVGLAKIKVINENVAYWYYFTFSDIDATTALYMVTLKCPVQPIVDIWDGVPRQLYSCVTEVSSVFADYTLNAYAIDYYDGESDTFLNLGSFASTSYLYLGFSERITGIKVYFGATNVNTTASTCSVQYYNGTTWISVGTLQDGTLTTNKTFNKNGTISWDASKYADEFPSSIASGAQWYNYRLKFSVTLGTKVYVDAFSGIPIQKTITPYRYPVMWNNRLWLLNNQSNLKNSALGGAYGTNCIFNGSDSGTLLFGTMSEITCGTTLFTRYGSSLFENLIVLKDHETYLVDGQSFIGDLEGGKDAFVVYQVSSRRGCSAPLTLQKCDMGYEIAQGVSRHMLIWLSSAGVVMFDSNSIADISTDIANKFYRTSAGVISEKLSQNSAAFFDAVRGEYHVMIPTGTSEYLNEELVYDLARKKWYQIKRGAKYLWCGFEVEDNYGNTHTLGGTSDGYLERLEYGTTMDGLSITYKFRTPDMLLNKTMSSRKEVRQIRLVALCKTTTAQTVAVSHYADGCTSASAPSITAMASNKSGNRFFKWIRSVSYRGVFHSFEFSITTDDETSGFDPLYIGGMFRPIDYDLEER